MTKRELYETMDALAEMTPLEWREALVETWRAMVNPENDDLRKRWERDHGYVAR
jgi:hypothetical protein